MKSLKLIGIKGAQRYEHWKRHTLGALDALHFSVVLQEVNDVDKILEYKVGAIPALLINDKVVIEQYDHVPNIIEIKASIVQFMINQQLKVPRSFNGRKDKAFKV